MHEKKNGTSDEFLFNFYGIHRIPLRLVFFKSKLKMHAHVDVFHLISPKAQKTQTFVTENSH